MRLSRRVAAPAPAVFHALTNPPALLEWLAHDARLEPQPGGRFYLWWHSGYAAVGSVSALVKNESLALNWRDGDGVAATVALTLETAGDDTEVTVAIDGGNEQLGTLWQDGLENLAAVLESGVDLRQARRPFLGIGGGAGLNAEMVADLGVPVTSGFRIYNVVDDSGAAQAGLRDDDVIVRVGEEPVADAASLQQALRRLKAGNTVPVTFYRGEIQLTVDLTLSAPPQPALPASAAELAGRVRVLYDALLADLDSALTGASAEALVYRPDSEEWSARDLLAHLIYTERWAHQYLTLRLAGLPQGGYANDLGVHAALADAYGDGAGLLDELRRAFDTTTAALASIPEALFRERKGALASISVTFLLGMPAHARTHIAEIRSRIAHAALLKPAA